VTVSPAKSYSFVTLTVLAVDCVDPELEESDLQGLLKHALYKQQSTYQHK